MRLSRLLAPAAAVLAAVALIGCSGSDTTSPARYTATVNFTGMDPHAGDRLWLRVVHVDSQVEVGRAEVATVSSPTFTIAIPDILVAGERYNIDFYADYNRNGRYDAPPVDHAWRRTIGPVTGNSTIAFMHDTGFTDIDWP